MMTAKLFENGRSQAVRLPKECQFAGDEVAVNKIGDIVILMPQNNKWSGFLSSFDMFSNDYGSGKGTAKRTEARIFMKYMLDTNICIYAIKNKPPEVIRNFLQHNPDDMCISSITYGELMHGVEKSQAVEKNRIAMSLFLSPITILDFDSYAAEEYGKIRADLERKGTPIGPLDMLIAGHAKSEELTVVTNNTREFYRVEGLAVEDWTKE